MMCNLVNGGQIQRSPNPNPVRSLSTNPNLRLNPDLNPNTDLDFPAIELYRSILIYFVLRICCYNIQIASVCLSVCQWQTQIGQTQVRQTQIGQTQNMNEK